MVSRVVLPTPRWPKMPRRCGRHSCPTRAGPPFGTRVMTRFPEEVWNQTFSIVIRRPVLDIVSAYSKELFLDNEGFSSLRAATRVLGSDNAFPGDRRFLRCFFASWRR